MDSIGNNRIMQFVRSSIRSMCLSSLFSQYNPFSFTNKDVFLQYAYILDGQLQFILVPGMELRL